MKNDMPHLRKLKARRILVLSAAAPCSGMQCIYLECIKDDWHILSYLTVPYPPAIRSVIEPIIYGEQRTSDLDTIAALDQRLTWFHIDCATATLAAVSKLLKNPDCIVLNKLQLWKAAVDQPTTCFWDIAPGDSHVLADRFNAPVLTDFFRCSLLRGGSGATPTLSGYCLLGRKTGPISFFVNIGLRAHMTIVDPAKPEILLSRDCGPGTSLIDAAAREAGYDDGIDRDGKTAATGIVDARLLDELLANECISGPQPITAGIADIKQALAQSSLGSIQTANKLATLTALTARSIAQTYQREFHHDTKPTTVWLSGGGSNNLTLCEFLKSYFAPMEVRNVEELGIPSSCLAPLALGLSANRLLDNQQMMIHDSQAAGANPPWRWVQPSCG
jgi:anhydro-N-acetylmuramic acid kinase